MSTRIDYEPTEGGLCVTRVVSTERTVTIPSSENEIPVVSISPGFMSRSPGMSERTLEIPGSVIDATSELLEGTRGISVILYDGELSVFQGFRVINDTDCTLHCLNEGEPFEFLFNAGRTMSFPEYDEEILNLHLGLTQELAVRRLSEPIGLNDVNRQRYQRFLSDSIMPKAEQAVVNGNLDILKDLLSTGMVSDDSLRSLLERSVRSGRVPVTSLLMSEIRRRSLIGKE